MDLIPVFKMQNTLPAVPCLEGAPTPPAPNLGLMEVPALEPIEFLLRLGSMCVFEFISLNNQEKISFNFNNFMENDGLALIDASER